MHFGLTSQDINNTSTPLMIKNSLEAYLLPELKKVLATLRGKLAELDVSMLAWTHGQSASPTNLANEIKVFIARLEAQVALLEQVPHSCRFGGATSNMNAHLFTYPSHDWRGFAERFCESRLG